MILKLKARKWHKNGNSFYIENQNDIVLHVKKNVVMIVSVIEHFWPMAYSLYDRSRIFLINNSFRSVASSLKIFDRTTLDLQFRMCYKVAFSAHKTCLKTQIKLKYRQLLRLKIFRQFTADVVSPEKGIEKRLDSTCSHRPKKTRQVLQ